MYDIENYWIETETIVTFTDSHGEKSKLYKSNKVEWYDDLPIELCKIAIDLVDINKHFSGILNSSNGAFIFHIYNDALSTVDRTLDFIKNGFEKEISPNKDKQLERQTESYVLSFLKKVELIEEYLDDDIKQNASEIAKKFNFILG